MFKRFRLNRLTIAFLLVLAAGKQSFSQDILGGEIRLRHLSAYQYEARVLLHYHENGGYPPFIIIDWGFASDTLFNISAVNISPQVVESEYWGTETYPLPGTYVFSVAENQWSSLIDGIPTGSSTPFLINNEFIISGFVPPNSSVVVLNKENKTISSNGVISYDPDFYDLDGDSLSFRLVLCDFPNYVLPPGLLIDSLTGVITFSPDTLGYFAVCVELEEWALIGQNPVRVGKSVKSLYLKTDAITNVKEVESSVLKIYPNPFIYSITIQLIGFKSKTAQLKLYDLQGKLLVQKHIQLTHGFNNATIDGVILPSGMYLLTLEAGEVVKTYKVVKSGI